MSIYIYIKPRVKLTHIESDTNSVYNHKQRGYTHQKNTNLQKGIYYTPRKKNKQTAIKPEHTHKTHIWFGLLKNYYIFARLGPSARSQSTWKHRHRERLWRCRPRTYRGQRHCDIYMVSWKTSVCVCVLGWGMLCVESRDHVVIVREHTYLVVARVSAQWDNASVFLLLQIFGEYIYAGTARWKVWAEPRRRHIRATRIIFGQV